MSSNFHLACIPSSNTYQSEFDKFRARNYECRNSLFDAVVHIQKISRSLLETCLGILSEVDRIENDLLRSINELIEMRQSIEWLYFQMTKFSCQQINSTLMESIIEFLYSELEQIVFKNVPVLEVNWKSNETPVLSLTYNPYVFLNHPVWTNGSVGKGENEYKFPCDLLRDPETGNIYTVDYNNSYIQIHSRNGRYLKKFTSDAFNGPRKLAMNGNYLYVVVKTDVILKLNKMDGSLLEQKKFDFFVGGFDFWEGTIYGGDYRDDEVHLINESLVATDKVVMQAKCVAAERNKAGIQYVKARADGLYLLFKYTTNFLQKFSYTGELLNCFTSDTFRDPWFFNLDPIDNVIITSSTNSMMMICNQKGEVLRTYKEASENDPGTINRPRGVAITQNFHIVVLNSKEEHCLQYY